MKANQFLQEDGAYSSMVPIVLAVIIGFAILFIGSYVNGQIRTELSDTMEWQAGDGDTKIVENMTLNRIDNVSVNYDSAIDIVQVVIIITLLAMALGAIFMFTRFR